MATNRSDHSQEQIIVKVNGRPLKWLRRRPKTNITLNVHYTEIQIKIKYKGKGGECLNWVAGPSSGSRPSKWSMILSRAMGKDRIPPGEHSGLKENVYLQVSWRSWPLRNNRGDCVTGGAGGTSNDHEHRSDASPTDETAIRATESRPTWHTSVCLPETFNCLSPSFQ